MSTGYASVTGCYGTQADASLAYATAYFPSTYTPSATGVVHTLSYLSGGSQSGSSGPVWVVNLLDCTTTTSCTLASRQLAFSSCSYVPMDSSQAALAFAWGLMGVVSCYMCAWACAQVLKLVGR